MNNTYQRERAKFIKDGYCVLDVNQQFQKSLHAIEEKIKSTSVDHWTYIIKHSDFEGDLPLCVDLSTLNRHRNKAIDEHNAGDFSFFFQRIASNQRISEYDVPDAILLSRSFMQSTEMKCILEYVSGRTINHIDQFYINKFGVGDFLGIHRDGGNNLGIALNISREWLTTNGGNTHIVDEELNIIDSISPRFGKLLIFDSKSESVPHFVSMVTATNGASRMAIIARFN
ncbi:2OG-Fe(II) oxygenase [Photobacterium leiognathi]|uniref:2OG-Fe(II) oxygenase n=1 Tax=Photobacterium leiognathi TaxID=553611 RepID=UPI0029824E35|nr:2OG-Fe(II) oxygenase [Photobacterium leiognathi]